MGVDDGLALLVADRLLGGVCAVSTVAGNVPVTIATRNALLFRFLLGRVDAWPVIAGASCASDGSAPDASHVHSSDGLGGATAKIDPALLQQLAEERVPQLTSAALPEVDAVTLIGIGPATNIPRLVTLYGRNAVKRIVLMSGSFFDVGNITPHAEFNAHSDPAALQATIDLRIPTLLVPLDVCRKVQLCRSEIAGLGDQRARGDAETHVLLELITNSHMRYMDFYRKWEGIDGCYPHDAVAVLAAREPEHFSCLRGKVQVDLTAEMRGRTTIALNEESHVEVAMGGDLKWVRETIRSVLSDTRAGQ